MAKSIFHTTDKNNKDAIPTAWYGILLTFLFIFAIIITQRAWLSDDAYITFRTVDNFINGYRLTWNTIERVQAYTHPLWMFLLSGIYVITHNMYMTGIGLGLGVSLLTVVTFVLKAGKSFAGSILGLVALSLSCAYVDYSTSGLENPLSHFILLLFLLVYFHRFRGDLFCLSFLTALAGMTRLDLLLVYLPALAYRFFEGSSWRRWINRFVSVLLGFIPLVTWELFSLFYYGFLFPNTAFAKLNTGIPSGDLLVQGLHYIGNFLERDPASCFIIGFGILLAILFPEFLKEKESNRWWANLNLPLVMGTVFYLIYIVKIGGDFMSGRFFTPLVLVSAVIISRINFMAFQNPRSRWVVFSILGIVVLILGVVVAPVPTFLTQSARQKAGVDEYGIADEREWYFDDMGFFNVLAVGGEPVVKARSTALELRQQAEGDLFIQVMGNTGVFGYYAGPNIYIIDLYALSEPLLARIPSVYDPNWRVGHYQRQVPDGYISKIYGLGEIADQQLAQYYEKLSVIIRGKLSDPNRLVEIWRMNTGAYQSLIDWDKYRNEQSVQ